MFEQKLNPLEWVQLNPTGTVPNSRSGHTITGMGRMSIMFGGIDPSIKKNGKMFPNNQVYTVKLVKDNIEWRQVPCGGDIPLERTNHAACAISTDKLFIFGGFYTSNLRFNDVYILKTTDFNWQQPPNQRSGMEPKNTESKIGAPEPRANCTANFFKEKVFIFGGHGGVGYQRTSYNDMYFFDCETSEWTKIEYQGGVPPECRGGHCAMVLTEKEQLIISGGWSSTGQFADIFCFDLVEHAWCQPDVALEIPRWYHSSICIPAIPSWKFFIFGGSVGQFSEGESRTQSRFSDEIFYFDVPDIKEIKICEIPIKGNNPKGRESATLFWDNTDSRLVLFGGWSNTWLNDAWSLKVNLITGPPYAVYSIQPNKGPQTGKTKVTITGDGFKDSNTVVRFAYSKDVIIEVNGTYVSNTELTCETPQFEKVDKPAVVTLSISKGDYTITSTHFQYYLNTLASECIAFGPGLSFDNAAGYNTTFYIQARNTKGLNRHSGADFFIVKMATPEEQEYEKEKAKAIAEGQEEFVEKEFPEIPCSITDLDNGQYICKYKQDNDIDRLKISIYYENENHKLIEIRGSPFYACHKIGNSPKNNELSGPSMIQNMTNQIKDIETFILKSKSEINIKNRNISEDVKELRQVKESLVVIQAKKNEYLLRLDMIEQCLRKYKDEGINKDEDLRKTLSAKENWNNLQNMAVTVEKDISVQVKAESDKAKDNLAKFEENLKEQFIMMKKRTFYTYQTGESASQVEIDAVSAQCQHFKQELDDFQEFANTFGFGEETQGSIKNLEMITNELNIVKKLWNHIKKCNNVFNGYLKLQYIMINPSEMEDEVKALRKSLLEIKGVDRKSNTFLGINEDIKKWATFMPLLNELKDPSMIVEDGRHWNKVKNLVNTQFAIDESLYIQKIWDLKLFNYKDEIEDITDTAKQELKMSKQITIVSQKWSEVEFELMKHKDTDIYTLKLIDENFETLEEHQLLVNNMLLSKYVGYFEKIIESWKQDLGAIYDVVQMMIEVQKSWSFLENLFIGSQEVQRELPNESKQFEQIHTDMLGILSKGCQIKNVKNFCTQDGLLKKIEGLEGRLKVCEKALQRFLDDKRCAFPRFYFVSVNDLLDILSNGNAPEKINRHMQKIFQAIDCLTLTFEGGKGDRPTAKSMVTCVGTEKVEFTKPLKLEGKVEVYLQELINTITDTLSTLATNSINKFSQLNDREAWLKMDPAQITLLINFIVWCRSVENSFNGIQTGDLDALKNYKKSTDLELVGLIKLVQGDLDKPLRQKIMCMITLDTHSRDIMDQLITENIRKPDEFQWQSQLKFVYNKEKSIAKCNIADASFWYSYEYLGNGPRLVITPLTDRIYVTATQALHLCLGCAPAGPAGTGKTESTKDLASALAKACYVFNCSPEMNYETLGNIFKGLASSGTWGCFDEFNRLIPEVLSVCSVQFKAVCDGVKANSARIIIEGDEVKLDRTCGAFITMNPGYLGRSELPEGLKVLFRPITVMVPDLVLICENMLMAEGFIDAKILANKFFTLYMLCRDLLSKADHYDWGLRAIKSVLVVAGVFKRAEPNVSEQAILMRALRDFNIPKITAADTDIFFGLLGDLFPAIHVERKRDMDFEAIIEQTCVDNKLYPEPEFIMKIVQLGELLQIRHCVFVMGPAGAGKTSTYKMWVKSCEKSGKKMEYVDLDPKVVHSRDLYGYMLPSKEWKDGLLSKLLRTYSEQESTNSKYIILDGDLDANWIESMNSVMDDNKILTLANNERIPVKGHMRLLFEIRDLKFATPATVSRAGILYISDDSGYQWKSYVRSWITASYADKEPGISLQKLFDRYIDPTLIFLKKSCKYQVPTSNISMIISLCKVMKALITPECKNIEYIFVFAWVWACAGGLAEKDGVDYRKEFSQWWKGEWKSSVKFPQKGSVFDYFVDQAGDQIKFEEWTKKVETIDFDTQKNHQMQQFAIPTRETVSTKEFINTFINVGHPSLIIGAAGAGKTQLANDIVRTIASKNPENFAYSKINCNFYTDSTYLQAMLEAPLKKLAGKQYGPGGKIRMIYYIDDLNMPQLDPYNTQTAIALLRQHADYQHWYDVSKLAIKEIINCQHLASMNPSAGSFYVNPRYQRHFWLVAVNMPDNESLFIIYNTFLQGHLKYFKPQVLEQVPGLIKGALTLHSSICSTFRKTALNFHYEFNLRHISGVFQGLLMAQPTQFQTPDKFVQLWIHESERVYGDRLVTLENLQTYRTIMFDLLKKSFSKFNFQRYFQTSDPEKLIFCNFCQGIAGERQYDLMPNDKLDLHVQDALKEYNDNNAFMGLVLFEDAVKHVCKITRIVQAPAGHALLVGVGGSGKQSLSKLASYIMNFTTVNITISSTYGLGDLKTDIQNYYTKAAIKDEGLLWLFTEGQITNERFLVYINDLLASGEIADLYTSDEKDQIINNVRGKVKNDGIPDTRENCWQWFIDKTKKNLHMSLCFSPVGESFRQRARKFPALVNNTVIDWFQPWPYEALMSVADSFLKETDMGDAAIHHAVVKFMPTSFTQVNQMCQNVLEQEKRYIYTTPKSFLELIQLYKGMLEDKKQNLIESKERYENGLIKLKDTAEQVEEIEKTVKIKGVEAEKKKNDAEKFAAVVKVEKEKVEAENDKANIEAAKCAQIKTDVTQKKESTEADLMAAIPLVEEAKKSLQGIQKKDFTTAKSFANPPQGVPEVFAACMYLMAGHWPDIIEVDKNKRPKSVEWKSCIKMMKNPEDFVMRLQDFGKIVDDNQVVAGNVKIIKETYISRPDFIPEIMEQKSGAAKGICSWVLNIVKYFDVIQQVEPKRKALAESTEQLESATTKLEAVQKIVAELNASLQKLVDEYNSAMAEKDAALKEAERCKTRLDLAQRLVSALGSENERWANAIVRISEEQQLVTGDVLIASAFISYTGPFNKKNRKHMIHTLFEKYFLDNKIPMTPEVNPVRILSDEAQIAIWNKDGLPSDFVSIENGTILTNSQRYPLIIDPQLQGNVWIKEKEKANGLVAVRLGSKNINRDIELAIERGNSILIENMDEQIDAILMPVISRQYIQRGRNKIMKFGGKDLTLHKNFRMFLHTKLNNPHYPPEVQAETTLINFTVTEDGLGDQLLTLVVGKERPDLAKKKIELIQEGNEFKIQLKELEKELLFKLANAKGDILDDIDLIINLENSKKISTEVAIKMEIGKKTEKSINESSEFYRPAAMRGALFYFLLTDICRVHSFYKYSLESYIVVINRAIDKISVKKEKPVVDEKKEDENQEVQDEKPADEENAEENRSVNNENNDEGQKKEEENPAVQEEEPLTPRSLKKRVDEIIESITMTSFTFTRRGLFEKHKIIVTAMLTLRILIRMGVLQESEVDHLIRGKVDPNPGTMPESTKAYLNDQNWMACKALEQISFFHQNNLCSSLDVENLQWKRWCDQEKPEITDLPKAFKDISAFHKLLLLRALRPDRILSALNMFIEDKMGSQYIEQPPFDMMETYNESGPNTPIFFVLFPGVDPTPHVEKCGAQFDISIANGRFINISMGQGQEERAKKALFESAATGNWVMLQNVHLMQTWLIGLNGLEGYLEEISKTCHENFRCFISSEPPPLPEMNIIPESILQGSIKVANEAPQDLKTNIRRCYAIFNQATIDKSPKPNEFKAILFSLCYFHSLILGRKKFGTQGWSRGYNFNDGDLTICANVLHNYLAKYEQIPYDDLKYIFGEIMYGGHITDAWDRRTNNTYLQVLVRPELLLNCNLSQGFKSPDPSKFDYEAYRHYIETKLPVESPILFGMHPNAEIGYLTNMCDTIFSTILEVQGGSGGAGKKDSGSMAVLMDLKARAPQDFNIFDIQLRIKEKAPYIIVCLQECERMNILLGEIKNSLENLRLGLIGALNITDDMENLSKSLMMNKVPPYWEKVAYFSKKPLINWFQDLIDRNIQLQAWSSTLETPLSVCISYLFNPMSYLTAIMQVTSRKHLLPLNDMKLQTNVTQFRHHEEVKALPENGMYIHGLFLEGASWELGNPGQSGYLIDQKLKELHPRLPIVNVIAVKTADLVSIGQYTCPVYTTSMRGPTFVFTSNMQMESEESDPKKWVLSGVCLLMSDD